MYLHLSSILFSSNTKSNSEKLYACVSECICIRINVCVCVCVSCDVITISRPEGNENCHPNFVRLMTEGHIRNDLQLDKTLHWFVVIKCVHHRQSQPTKQSSVRNDIKLFLLRDFIVGSDKLRFSLCVLGAYASNSAAIERQRRENTLRRSKTWTYKKKICRK